ncbi:MAG: hypothetical protein RIE53_06085 [Rhodothermales bacterium]
MRPRFLCLLAVLLGLPVAAHGQASFEEAVIDVGNVGITITNAGLFGRSSIRNNPSGPPSFEYPLNEGVEHLFEAGVWIGATRSDGTETVRTAAVTSGGGYAPGAPGYEFASFSGFTRRSSLTTSAEYSRSAVSHQDFLTAFEDTSRTLPNTNIQMPDQSGRLGAMVHVTTHAWSFPFTEAFAIVNLDIVNISSEPWDSVYVGLFHDLVVRNVNTTNDTGGAFFNKGGLGYVDSLQAMYAFNAGGLEETLNTYGAVQVLGAEWFDPARGEKRFFHPAVADEYVADGYTAPTVNPRWWLFSGGSDELNRPNTDADRYRRMATPYPDPAGYPTQDAYEAALEAWYTRLRTDGQISTGNWIGLTPLGPFPRVNAGDTLQVTFALVAALKPEEFQGQAGKAIDTPESRTLLATNLGWARRTYSGEDNNFNGRLDPGEDVNGNGVLDRYLIPEPPASPRVRVEFERNAITDEPVVALYWDRTAEESRDPVTGIEDFEGYRIYRSDPGDDRGGNLAGAAGLVAQYDTPGNTIGFNNGFGQIALQEPALFEGDETEYWYRFEAPNLKNGWQYLFAVTAFDSGDPDAGLEPFESSRVANSVRVFPGTPANTDGSREVGVYPNPYRVNAAWDGTSNRSRKLNFYNLPPKSEIRIYTLAGEPVKTLYHDADTYTGDTGWYTEFGAENGLQPGGEHSWDLLSENGLGLAGGLYLFTVEDLDDGSTQRGKFVIIK